MSLLLQAFLTLTVNVAPAKIAAGMMPLNAQRTARNTLSFPAANKVYAHSYTILAGQSAVMSLSNNVDSDEWGPVDMSLARAIIIVNRSPQAAGETVSIGSNTDELNLTSGGIANVDAGGGLFVVACDNPGDDFNFIPTPSEGVITLNNLGAATAIVDVYVIGDTYVP